MDEEKDQQVGQAPQPDSQDLPPSPAKRGDKPMTKGQRQRRQRSVFQYIAILFAAAFLLLLYSFMMERRQYQSRNLPYVGKRPGKRLYRSAEQTRKYS